MMSPFTSLCFINYDATVKPVQTSTFFHKRGSMPNLIRFSLVYNSACFVIHFVNILTFFQNTFQELYQSIKLFARLSADDKSRH